MTASVPPYVGRDYSLTGAETRHAIKAGLALAQWYHRDVPRKAMKALMQRRDGPELRDTAIWIGRLVLTAGAGIALWGTWLALGVFVMYGVLNGSACDSRWHECGHGTAFRTPWMNNAVDHIAAFMVMRNPVSWRWSYARHHTDSIIVGCDPEIGHFRPPHLLMGGLHDIPLNRGAI